MREVEKAKVPKWLKPYKIIETHSDGDLTVRHLGNLYVITTEGQVFKHIKSDE